VVSEARKRTGSKIDRTEEEGKTGRTGKTSKKSKTKK